MSNETQPTLCSLVRRSSRSTQTMLVFKSPRTLYLWKFLCLCHPPQSPLYDQFGHLEEGGWMPSWLDSANAPSNIFCFLVVSHVLFETRALENRLYILQSFFIMYTLQMQYFLAMIHQNIFLPSLLIITHDHEQDYLLSFWSFSSHLSCPTCMLIGFFCRSSYHELYLISGKTLKWDFLSAQ